MMSPVFKENMYQGVYNDIHPEDIPDDIDLFNIDSEKHPLLAMVSEYVLTTELVTGDCLYVPSLYWLQSESMTQQTMIHTSKYGAISRLVDLLFEAIDHADILEKL